MTLDELLSECKKNGVQFAARDGDLDVRAPRGALTPEIRALLAEHKGALIRHVTGEAPICATPDPEARFEPFDLTDIQVAYLFGRQPQCELGGVGICGYAEIDARGLDPDRLQTAWNRLIRHHDMLRCTALADGRQRVLSEVRDYVFPIVDLPSDPTELKTALANLRAEMLDRTFSGYEWPLFDIRLSRVNGSIHRLHVTTDGLNIDLWSFSILAADWVRLYEQPQLELPVPEISFRDYVMALARFKETADYRRSAEYWRSRACDPPAAPSLPYAKPFGSLKGTDWKRRELTLPRAEWKAFKSLAAKAGVTPASALLTAYAEVLALWSEEPEFTLNITLFNRLPLHRDVDSLVGDFSSILLLPYDAGGAATFTARARRVQAQLSEDLDQRVAGGIVAIREVSRRRASSAGAHFPCVFTGTLGTSGYHELGRLGDVVQQVTMTPQVALDEQVFEFDGGLRVSWDAVESLFPPGLLDDMFDVHRTLLSDLCRAENWSRQGPVVPVPSYQKTLIDHVNATQADIPDRMIDAYLRESMEADPDSVVVSGASVDLDRREVWHRTKLLAQQMRATGAAANRPLAIMLPGGPDQVIAVYAALLAGAAYLPLDPAAPGRRVRDILNDAKPALAITDADGAIRDCWPDGLPVVRLDEPMHQRSAARPPARESVRTPDDTACIIYTSGSTGTPKGVTITHRGIVNRMTDAVKRFSFDESDVALGVTALHHDMSVIDIIGLPAFAGGSVAVLTASEQRDPRAWADRVERDRVTIWVSVPTFLAMFVEHLESLPKAKRPDLSSLRLVMLGGDFIPLDLPDRFRALVPDVDIHSIGGPTETTIFDISHPIGEVDQTRPSIPYGRPLGNTAYHVLDAEFRGKPFWAVGELCVTGAGLARGYWLDPLLTADRFVRHPATGERLYRTGDMGRWWPDGSLEILGRRDGQVKLNGQRIELPEIESVLVRHPAVKAGAVTLASGPSRRLVAHVVPAPGFWERRAGDVVTDLEERARFKLTQPGVRVWNDHESARAVRLPAPSDRDKEKIAARHSHRRFLSERLEYSSFLSLLAVLAADSSTQGGLPRRRYGSAGALYPVRVYLQVMPERIEELGPGMYEYDPIGHRLLKRESGRAPDPMIHAPNNRAFARQAAFTLFMVAHYPAIRPLYGNLARDFCLLEAGYIAQLLMETCASTTVGLCPIGLVDGDALGNVFGNPEEVEVIHAVVGGKVDPHWITEPPPPHVEADDGLAEALRTHLKEVLPRHMVPETYVVADRLPLTANGKIDRKSLPNPDPATSAGPKGALRTDTERGLAEIWRRLLERTDVGVEDSFFRLGGDSLLATRMCIEVQRKFGIELPVTTVFEAPTLAALSAKIDAGTQVETTPIPKADASGPILLSHQQLRLWLHEQLHPGRNAYSEVGGVHLPGPLDIAAVERALSLLLARHDILRTRFIAKDGQPEQVVEPSVTLGSLKHIDLSGGAQIDRQGRIADLMRAEATEPFDLERAPLLRACVVETSADDALLLVVIHHIVSDLWSMGVFAKEFSALYEALRQGRAPVLDPLPLQYSDFAAWQRSNPVPAEDLNWWIEYLQDLPPLELPTDYPRPSEPSFRGARRSITMSDDVTFKLESLGRGVDASLFAVLTAAWAAVLQRHAAQNDIGIGVPVSGRDRPDLQPLIGFFANTLVLRADLTDAPSFESLIRRVRDGIAQILRRQHVPFEEIVGRLRTRRDAGRNPVFQTLVVLQSDALIEAASGRLLRRAETDGGTEHFDLTLIGQRDADGLTLTIRYATDLFSDTTAERMLAHLVHFLSAGVEAPGLSVADLPLAPAFPLIGPRQPETEKPGDFVARILDHGVSCPAAPAVLGANGKVAYRYGDLLDQSRAIAASLVAGGIGCEDVVAVCLPRSPDMVAAALGVLRAGAVFAPLNNRDLSTWPDQIETLGAVAALTDAAGAALLSEVDVRLFDLDGVKHDQPATAIDEPVEPYAACYVIPTSGVQGAPKPVVVSRKALSEYLISIADAMSMTRSDIVLHTADFSFSSAMRQMFTPLSVGAALVVASDRELLSPTELFGLVKRANVSVLDLVPSFFNGCIDVLEGQDPSDRAALLDNRVRLVACASEALHAEVPRRWQALGHSAPILNMYGLTESCGIRLTTADTLPDGKEAGAIIALGKPLAGCWAAVCDDRLLPLPPGMVGEICLGGCGLARSFLGAPALTAEHFVPDPFSDEPGARLLRTGDLGRVTESGEIAYVGRKNNQIKLRGKRIDLTALEGRVAEVPGVGQAVAVVETGSDGYPRLRIVAETKTKSAGPVERQQIATAVSQFLPESLATIRTDLVDALPRTRSGKVARTEVAAMPLVDMGSGRESRSNGTAAILAEIWADILRLPHVGPDDGFFALGGDSIQLMRMIARAERAKIHLTPRDVIQHQTIAELLVSRTEPIGEPVHRDQTFSGPFALLPSQNWFFDQTPPHPHHWNLSVELDLLSDISTELLEQALAELVVRHDALRLRFALRGGGWQQHCFPRDPGPFLRVADLTEIAEPERKAAADLRVKQLKAGLHLENGPVFAGLLVSCEDGDRPRLVLTAHHLCVDAVSWYILVDDLARILMALIDGREPEASPQGTRLPELVSVLAARAQDDDLTDACVYWTEMGPINAGAPRDRVVATGSDTQIDERRLEEALQAEETSALQNLPRDVALSVDDATLTALALAWREWAGRPLYVEIERHGRDPEFETCDLTWTVGWISTVYPVLIDVTGDDDPLAAGRTVSSVMAARRRDGWAFGLARHLALGDNPAKAIRALPTPPIRFNHLGRLDDIGDGQVFSWRDNRGLHDRSGSAPRRNEIRVDTMISRGRFRAIWSYAAARHDRASIARLSDGFMTALRTIIAIPPAPVMHLPSEEMEKLKAELQDAYPLS